MKTCCIVVIGHVDHGKTSLVHALTGIHTDRLPEEKARGLSITPGFAHYAYPDGIIDFIDAPGHEDFIPAMISGATGARAALVVISAAEGIGAQTLEHVSIAKLLGITRGVIAVTKSDLLPPAQLASRLIEIRAAFARTPLADAPLVTCSAITGDGIDDLHAALQAVLLDADAPWAPLHGFLAVDRAFSLPGRGTIVTGTLLGHALSVEDAVMVQPAGQAATIRGLHSRGTARDTVHAGERVAVNLRGVGVSDIARGAVLCTGGAGAPSACIDARVTLQPSVTRALKHMEEVRVSFGTTSAVASVRLFGGGRIAPADAGFVQLRFKKPVTAFAGQRAVLRRLSPAETIGGAVILDPQAMPSRSGDKGRLCALQAAHLHAVAGIATALSDANGGVARLADVARLGRVTAQSARVTLGDGFQNLDADLIAPDEAVKAGKTDVMKALAAYHTRFPLRSMAPKAAITFPALSPALLRHITDALCASGQIRQHDNRLAASSHNPVAVLNTVQRARLTDIENAFREAGLSPPATESVVQDRLDQDLFDLLIDLDALVPLRNVALKQTLILHTNTLAQAASVLSAAFAPPQTFTTSQARSALATTRRIIVPVLEHFDSCGVTIRNGDARRMAVAKDF